MSSLQNLQKISKQIRWSLFATIFILCGIALFGLVTEGEWWVSIGNEEFELIWQNHPDAKAMLLLTASPLFVALLLGFYCLQRLLLELSHGHFFSSVSMRCLKWLAWLCFFGVLYNMMVGPFRAFLLEPDAAVEVNINFLTLIMLLCLPVVVHLFSAASELDRENKEII